MANTLRAWEHCLQKSSLKYVSLRKLRASSDGSSAFCGVTRKVARCLGIMGREQGTGPQVSRVRMGEGKGEVEGI